MGQSPSYSIQPTSLFNIQDPHLSSHVQTCSIWTSLYSPPPSQVSPSMLRQLSDDPSNPVLIYCPQRSWGKVMFPQACVILFMGGCLPQCMLGYTPREQTSPEQTHTPPQTRTPPGADTSPPDQTPLGADTPLEQTPPRADTPLNQTLPWEQTPPGADTPPGPEPPRTRYPPASPSEHAGRYGQHAGGTHPTGMQSC